MSRTQGEIIEMWFLMEVWKIVTWLIQLMAAMNRTVY